MPCVAGTGRRVRMHERRGADAYSEAARCAASSDIAALAAPRASVDEMACQWLTARRSSGHTGKRRCPAGRSRRQRTPIPAGVGSRIIDRGRAVVGAGGLATFRSILVQSIRVRVRAAIAITAVDGM